MDVKGKIVIARYGGGWRGLKPKLASEHGAVGCIIYSDPQHDGYGVGDVYPKGGRRPSEGLQRGSVADLPVIRRSSDSRVGATKNAKRLKLPRPERLMKIPVMPISYGDAQPLFAALAGPVAPAGWRGALPITYHIGPGPAKVHLEVTSDWGQKPLYDVIAKIPGTQSGRMVIRGNHRDGWVFGAWDPLVRPCGDAGRGEGDRRPVEDRMEAEAHTGLRELGRRGAGPPGSTEWVETHAGELQ